MIDLQLIGADAIATGLDRFAPRLADEVRAGVGALALRLTRSIQQDKLSGQVLKARSWRLQQSIRATVESDGTAITASVTATVTYAAAHEYGFHGTVTVRQHLRQIRRAFGRSISPGAVTVKAHAMRMNLPERSFLRAAMADFEASGVIRDEIDAAIGRATA